MKCFLKVFIFLFVCGLIFEAGCQEQNNATLESDIKRVSAGQMEYIQKTDINELAPKLVFDNVIHDFGEVKGGSGNFCEFRFTNKGNGILKVNKKVKITCGCTVPRLAKEEYEPNESGIIKVTYRSGKNPGSSTKHLYVSSNDKDNPEIELTIKARVVKKVKFEPKMLNLLLDTENADCPEIKLTSLDKQPFSITRFHSVPNCITADYDPSVKAIEFTVKPKVDVEKLKQHLKGSITINLTHPQDKTIRINFEALSRFKAEPSTLTTFNAESGKSIRKTVYILSNYNEDFEVESISTENDLVKIISREKVGSRYKLEVDIVPPPVEKQKRHFADKLTIHIKGGEKLEIKCLGVYLLEEKK